MFIDILTVTNKELREYLSLSFATSGVFRILVLIGIFGIFMPLQNGVEGITSGMSALFIVWMPFMMISGIVADSFAGERERHTLESLLATRLPDLAILLGKMMGVLLYGFIIATLCFVASLVAINITRLGEPVFYPPVLMVTIPILIFLVSWLASAIGVIVSLRASTAREAAQWLFMSVFLLLIPLLALPLIVGMLPAVWQFRIMAFLDPASNAFNPWRVAAAFMLSLTVVNLALTAIANKRFKRDQLILP